MLSACVLRMLGGGVVGTTEGRVGNGSERVGNSTRSCVSSACRQHASRCFIQLR